MIDNILALTTYFAIYGLIHSWLANASVKNWARQIFGPPADRWYRLLYNVFATVTLLPMLAMMAFLPNQTLYSVPSPWRELMIVAELLAALLAAVSLWQTGAFHFLGLTQLVAETPNESKQLNLGGFYTWVRHPLYTLTLIFLWLSPDMSLNSLIAYILFTLYFYFSSVYEERRLVAEFGTAYEDYRRQVPRLIPWPGRRYHLHT